MMQSIAVIPGQIRRYAAELNFFEDEASRSNQFHLRTAIVSTRVYVALLTVAIIILVVFTSLSTQSEVITIRNPSQADYEALLNKNAATLLCPCSHVTIPYGNFTWTTVHYNPVCSSVFITNEWIKHLFSADIGGFKQRDFRALASSYFQLLAAFCSHANRSVDDALDDFDSETLLTSNVLLPNSFNTTVEVKSKFVQLSTANNVRRLLQLVRTTTHANVLQTAIQTSTIMQAVKINSVLILRQDYVSFQYKVSPTCQCVSSRDCFLPSGFFGPSLWEIHPFIREQDTSINNVTGFFVGCTAVESLLLSTLECLFDRSCLETIHKFIPSSNITGVYPLNKSRTKFAPNTSIETIINSLFIENWSTKQSFPDYYVQCAPLRCTYTLIQRNNALYILTKLLGLYGGLTAALRLCIPLIIGWWRKRKLITSAESRPIGSYMQRLQRVWRLIRIKIIELNMFKTSTMRTNPFERTTLRISTWIYLSLLCSSMITIVLFTWLSVRIQSALVENPSLTIFEDLQRKYPTSLQCPCSQIVIPYGSFISLLPEFHPVCTSDFVSNTWIHAIALQYVAKGGQRDIMTSGSKFFRSLATLCGLLNTTVSDASFIFNQSSIITNLALSEAELHARARQALDQFKSNTVAEFKRSLALIRSQTTTMYTTGSSDVSWNFSPWRNNSYSMYFQAVPTQFGICSCALSDECKESIVVYNYTLGGATASLGVLYNISNMFTGCFAIQSLLESSSECVFDQIFVDRVLEQLHKSGAMQYRDNVSILQMNSTRFSPNTTFEEIIDEMMIETWNENIDYNQYYAQCASKLCSYSFTSRNNALYVFTTIVGLFGGLSVALKVLVPLIVGWIRNKMRPRVETDSLTLCERVHVLWRLIKTKVVELNLFESEASWDDPARRRVEIISTRIYILLLTFAVIILIVYTAFTVRTQNFTVEYPSQSTFEQLVSDPRYSPSLDCPCQNISIPYDSFISISLQYHQLCSSDFVVHNSLWIKLVYYGSDPINYPYDDYRFFIVPHFRLLFYLCSLANDTLTDALAIFRSNILVSKRAQSRQAVETQMEAALKQFRLSIPRTFKRTLDFIRHMAQGNGLVTPTSSNWHILPLETFKAAPMGPRSYGDSNCSCGTSALCTSPAAIGKQIVPGFRVGCYAIESLLQSTLECLYNMTCINSLKNTNYPLNISIHPLNSTRSPPNDTVQSLVDVLMVHQREPKITYEDYYSICATRSCNYVLTEQANSLYIITTIIGLCGGLTVALKVIVPVLVQIGRYLIRCRRQRIEPVVAVVPDHE